MGKHSPNTGGPFNRKRSAGPAAAHERRGMRTLGGDPVLNRPRKGSGRAGNTTLEKAPARLKAERGRRRQRYKRAAIATGIAVTVLLIAAVAGAWGWIGYLNRTMAPSVTRDVLSTTLQKAKPQKPFTVLLLGSDRRKKGQPDRTDTMLLAKVDPQTKEVWMLSIPRDARVEIPGRGATKINQAFTYGGAAGSIDAVTRLTGVPINHYMQVDFEGFAKAVDALGGVWVDVPVAINDRKAASYYGQKAQRIDAGYQQLDGAHALTFVRARHQFADQDFSRMKNQQIFFKALADQVAKTQNIAKLPRVVNSVAPYVETDMSVVDMVRTAQSLRGGGSDSVYTETLAGVWRTPFVHIDEANMAALIEKMEAGVDFHEKEPEEGEEAEEAEGYEGVPSKAPRDIGLTVRNGGGVAGSAKQASSILKARGFKVTDVGNTNQFVYEETLVVYKDDKASAGMVAKALPPGTKLVESRGMYAFDTTVLVIIGKDWDLSKVPVTQINTN